MPCERRQGNLNETTPTRLEKLLLFQYKDELSEEVCIHCTVVTIPSKVEIWTQTMSVKEAQHDKAAIISFHFSLLCILENSKVLLKLSEIIS